MRWVREHEALALVIFWLALALVLLTLSHGAVGAPGMFYDEGWLAQQGRAFVDPEREGALPPGTQSVEILGRPLPLFALPYLGSLKSQLLIPWFFAFGNELETLRLATLVNALLALLATMFAVRRIFGVEASLLTGVLLVSDPTVFFHAQWEWGPFTTGWLCRAVGAALLLRSYAVGGRASACAGAFALGLSGYNRADSVLVLASVGLGLLAFHRQQLAALWRERRSDVRAAGGFFLLGALPILLNIPRVLGTYAELSNRGDFAERIRTLLTTLDGSYAHRLMEVGGRFDAMQNAPAPFALFGLMLFLALAVTAASALRGRGAELRDGRGALAISCVAVIASMLALEGATRAHHALNHAPLTHTLVAATLVTLSRRAMPVWSRLASTACAVALIASNANSIASTRELIERTGGRGWWSGAIAELGAELEAGPPGTAVSFDWGFHLPLLFLTESTRVIEPIWEIEDVVRKKGIWDFAGDETHRYVVHDAPYDRFGFGPRLLTAARVHERMGRPVEIRSYHDREGATAFLTISFRAPHRIVLKRGAGFRIEFD